MPRVVKFYGWTNPNGEFSNFYPKEFTYNGSTFRHAEQFIMYRKAALFKDWLIADAIMQATEPAECKRLGRQVCPFNEVTWDRECDELVFPGLLAKFEQNEYLRDYLLSTGDDILAECSPRDLIWGIGLSATNPRVDNPNAWRGNNRLGNLLMQVRAELRKKGYSAEYVAR